MTPKPKSKERRVKYLGKWHMGNIALFGALLMSEGIVGEEKEFFKNLMHKALTPSTKPKR